MMMFSPSQPLRFGPYELYPAERSLLRDGEPVHLTPRLFETLLFLVQNVGHLVEREALIRAVWKDAFVEDGNLAHNISALRKILGHAVDGRNYIETIPRYGYRFVDPLEPTRGSKRRPTLNTVPDERPAIHSLAVLPLGNLSKDPDQEYFTDGMTEALIAGLSQTLPLRVISRTSIIRYKGTDKPLPQIGEELNVDAILEGTVFRAGTRIRVTVQLIYAPQDHHLWSQSYERDLRDVLKLQKDLARSIAGEIKAELKPQQRVHEKIKRLSPAAYEAYLKGRYSWNLRTENGLLHSIDCYLEATSHDPQYALAFSGLADSYALLGNRRLGNIPPEESILKAKSAASRALELDSNLAEAHLSLAMLHFQYDWDWAVAEEGFRTAIRLNPNAATSHHRYAMYLATMNRMSDARVQMERARILDPLSPIIATATGRLLHFQRKYDEAIEWHRRALAIDPEFIEARFNLGMIYEQKLMFQEAISEFRKVIRMGGENAAFWSAGLGHAYALAGMKDEAREILRELQKVTAERRTISPFDIAWVRLGLKEMDAALWWMEKAVEEHCGALVYQNIEPALDVLRTNSRFQRLLTRIGLPH
jgi:TolB-like protein